MRVRLLGPVDVMVDGEARPVPGLRRKAVLATLALHGGEIVSTDRLLDAVWAETAPPALNTLQSNVSYLRGVLGSKAAILARPPGYLLDLGEDCTDVRLAERMLRQGRQSADPRQGAAELRQALSLWRGRPLADVTGLAWLEDQAGRLDLLRQQIERALSDARLAAGEHLQLVPELEQMASGHPLDEHVHAQFMLALYRSGRQADALSVYQRLRRVLAEELGIDPSQALRELETAILQQDPSLDTPAPPGTLRPAPPSALVPAQLPPAVAGFAGRDTELADLDAFLPDAGPDGAADDMAVIVAVISGTAGVGKTALAVHWAHRAAARFPDGQLYANLRGFDPAGPPVEPGQALRGFLDAFAVPPERIPASLDDQVALYRTLLAGRRVLVVLDNARDAGQVRVLLPGAPGCLAVVTSRNRLSGLIARDGARPLNLDVLTPGGARELLTRRLGASRLGIEPDAAGDIITRCARLPLALTIAAARAAASPGFPLAHVAAEMREAGQVLDPFGGDDAATDVRAVFSWSYRGLSADAARLFRLLGLHPGPDITVGAAASLAGIGPERARALLAELTSGHLLAEHRPGRYAFHDLLRAYAAEQARIHDDDDARDAAAGRLLDHCLQVAHAAATLIDPYFAPVAAPPAPPPGRVVGGPATPEEALSCLAAERVTLLAAVPLAAAAALKLSRAAGDLALEVTSLNDVGYSHALLGNYRQAISYCERSLAGSQAAGERNWESAAWDSLGYIHHQLGSHGRAITCYERSLDLCRALADRFNEAVTLDNLGDVHRSAGHMDAARWAWAQAARAFDEIGHPGAGQVRAKLGGHGRRLPAAASGRP